MKKFDSIIPLSYFKQHSTELLGELQFKQQTIILTRHGKGVVVLQDLESFQNMARLAEQAAQMAALEQTLGAGAPDLNGL